MLKHILIPLDGSQLAEQALEYGLRILEPNGRLTLVSAVEVPEVPVYGFYPPATTTDFKTTQNDLLPYARHYLDSIAQDLIQRGYVVDFEAHVGDPAGVITEVAQRQHIDAIVMSTHGRSGISRWLFGSVTQKILSARLCPVFVIPSGVTVESGAVAAHHLTTV